MKRYEIWTDGSCKANGTSKAVGAWGFIILDQDRNEVKKDSFAIAGTTNNRMEMEAIINGIKALEAIEKEDFVCSIYSDSAYVMNCYAQKWYIGWMKNGWKTANKSEVKNQDLWEQLVPFFNQSKYSFLKVKGHNGVEINEQVDIMVQGAAAHLQEELDLC